MTVHDDRADQRGVLERFARAHPGSVLYDGATLLDVASGKALALDWRRVARVEERRDTASGRTYLAIRRDDGGEIAVAEQGVVFPPGTAATGPVPGLPAAVCFRDLAQGEARLTHFLVDHPGEPPEPGREVDHLPRRAVPFCSAVLPLIRFNPLSVPCKPSMKRMTGCPSTIRQMFRPWRPFSKCGTATDSGCARSTISASRPVLRGRWSPICSAGFRRVRPTFESERT